MSLSKTVDALPKLLASYASQIYSRFAEEVPKVLNSKAKTACTVLAVYMIICRSLRHERRRQKHAKFRYKSREDFAKMTVEDAWEIYKYVSSLEFPFLTETALQFALFR